MTRDAPHCLQNIHVANLIVLVRAADVESFVVYDLARRRQSGRERLADALKRVYSFTFN